MKYELQARTQAKRTSLSQYTFARPPRRLDIVTVGHSSNLMKKNGNLNISSLTQNLEKVKEERSVQVSDELQPIHRPGYRSNGQRRLATRALHIEAARRY